MGIENALETVHRPSSVLSREASVTSTFSRREIMALVVASLVGLVVLPALNAFLPADHPLHVSSFGLSVYGKYLCYAVLAIGINLLWGYTGILSLGQCLFFALGGYAFGMYLMLRIGRLGQYQKDLPDFMVFLEYETKYDATGGLPPHWLPFDNVLFALAAVIWVPALVAWVFGFLAFRSRIKGVYFSILSQALTYAACLMFFRNDFTFGGNNGFTDFKYILGTPVFQTGELRDPDALAARLNAASDELSALLAARLSPDAREQLNGGVQGAELEALLVKALNQLIHGPLWYDTNAFASIPLQESTLALVAGNPRSETLLRLNRVLLQEAFPAEIGAKRFLGYEVNAASTKRALYIASGLLLLGVYLFCRWLTSTKFGLIQRAIRDSENRVLFSGYATVSFKLFVFVIAAVIAGLGGALYLPQVGAINPSEMSPAKSLEAVVWVAVGGRGSMLGPILGAVGINALKSYATHAYAEQWPYLLGGLFIFVTLFMPKGLIGLPGQCRELWRRRIAAPAGHAPDLAIPSSSPQPSTSKGP
jgi:ABC-type branched-subunit amino acid transport system permease subunit